jgi:hypothetical protein
MLQLLALSCQALKSRGLDMARKSTVDKLAPDVRSHIERALRENRLTLDELITDLQQAFPAEEKPSRSALGRYRQQFDVMVERMREQETMSRLLVSELGENPDDRAGALMVQSLSVLVNSALADAQEDQELAVDDIRKLARATKDAIQARSASLKERQAIEAAAREKLLAEQKEKLAAMPSKGGVTEETKQAIREALGIS